jgi:hypothetical protein
LKLLCHINNDGDLLEAWFKYYLKLGITSFHLIVHGSRDANAKLYELKDSFPVVIIDSYTGEFDIDEKERRMNEALCGMRGEWVLLVDSDEFVELPYKRLSTTIRLLRLIGMNALLAPLLQRFRPDGSIEASEIVIDPFAEFPMCSESLCEEMAVNASASKYPLFYCNEKTRVDGGNHGMPHGLFTSASGARGVTHHFKWRMTLLKRLDARINSSHRWRQESIGYKAYLENRGYCVPTGEMFPYSRRTLFDRELLVRPTLTRIVKGMIKDNLLSH